jgi:PST family polysaccharide transporter
MWSGLLVAGVAYATRALIAREIDLIAVGIFSAAYGLSGMVVNFVLGAMGADYYPSLTAVNHDHQKMRDLVNQQTEVGLLLALPGLLGTLALAPWAIKLFYSSEFWQAADLLRWFVLGCLGRVISWPLGFILLAKGASRLFAVTETLANLLHIGLIWGLLSWVGIEGASIAFFVLYVFYSLMMLLVVRYLIGFSWSRGVWKLQAILLPIVIGTFLAGTLLPDLPATIVGLATTAGVSFFCLRGLTVRLGPEHKVCRLARKIPLLNLMIPPMETV